MISTHEVVARVRIPEPPDVRYRVRPARQITAEVRRASRAHYPR
jgi:hypothetical protein